MTTNYPDVSDSAHSMEDDDLIDPRKYVDFLIRWWREIALFAILGAIGAGTLAFIVDRVSPPVYEASATAIIARVTSNVTLDDRFQTQSDESAAVSAARRASLVGLVRNGAIADAVREELTTIAGTDDLTSAALLDLVVAEAIPSSDSRTPSDLIRITATAHTPDLAASIANAWMRHYVEEANRLYGQVPNEVFDAVVAERTEAQKDYVKAQGQLEAFVGQSLINTLSRQIAEQDALLQSLNQGQIDASVAALTQESDLRIARYESLAAAQTEPLLALLDEQTRQNVLEIANLLAVRSQATRQLTQAQALRRQIEEGGDATVASNQIALQILKSQIFADQSNVEPLVRNTDVQTEETPTIVPAHPQPIQWSITAPNVSTSSEEQLQDVTALVASLESYLLQLDEQIETAGAQAGTGEGYRFLERLNSEQLTTVTASARANEAEPADPLAAAILAGLESLSRPSATINQSILEAVVNADSEFAAYAERLEQSIQALSAQLEAERSVERQLTQQRDLAWNAYDTLSNKVVELNLERTAANREVRQGTLATVPLHPIDDTSTMISAAIGGVIGLFLGVFVAFFMNYLGKEPFLSRRNAL